MVGQTLDRYSLVEKLGSGGMGDVFKGYHPSLDQYRAVKILPPYLSGNPELVERFFREARRCAALHHPNIVRLEHVGEQDGLYYMVMDYVPGGSLRQLIDSGGPVPIQRGLHIAAQVCRALAHAHAHGVVHRDVKPSNILIGADDQVFLTDFGIARGVVNDEPGLTAAGVTLGTPEYMSPEQVRGEPVDGRSDLYSLGIVLYEMFTGELPFTARSKATVKRQQLEKRPDSPRFYNPELPEGVEQVILQALEKAPADRFASAEEMELALIAVQAEPVDVVEMMRPQPVVVPAAAPAAVPVAAPAAAAAAAAPAAATPPRPERESAPTPVEGEDLSTAFTERHDRTSGWRDRSEESEAPTTVLTGPLPAAAAATAAATAAAATPAATTPTAIPGLPPLPDFRELWPRLKPAANDRRSMLIVGGATAAALLIGFGVLQQLGNASTVERFSAEKGLDPRTGKEYGIVQAHGVPVFVISQEFGDLTPAERAEKAAQRLGEIIREADGKPLDPESIAALENARGETVIARRPPGSKGKEPDPRDVIVTVDSATASNYADTTRTKLALWWRDILRDQVRLAQGKPPVSTFETGYGKLLDRVYQQVEGERQGEWVPADEVRKTVDDLPEAQRNSLETGWRTVPANWSAKTAGIEDTEGGRVAVARQGAQASSSVSTHPASYAVDGDPKTAWLSGHGFRHHGYRQWLKVEVPDGTRVSELEIVEGRRSRPQFQLRPKMIRATFSDGSVRRLWRRRPGDPLRITFPARTTDWVKLEVEQVFANRAPRDSHFYLSEVRLWRS